MIHTIILAKKVNSEKIAKLQFSNVFVYFLDLSEQYFQRSGKCGERIKFAKWNKLE